MPTGELSPSSPVSRRAFYFLVPNTRRLNSIDFSFLPRFLTSPVHSHPPQRCVSTAAAALLALRQEVDAIRGSPRRRNALSIRSGKRFGTTTFFFFFFSPFLIRHSGGLFDCLVRILPSPQLNLRKRFADYTFTHARTRSRARYRRLGASRTSRTTRSSGGRINSLRLWTTSSSASTGRWMP